jgi:hypothetical protein
MTAGLDAPWVLARVVPACGACAIERVGPLTPYLTQTIVEDARAAGRGSRVQLEVTQPTSLHVLETVRRRLRLLTGRDIRVAVRRRQHRRSDRPLHVVA